ncbi:putative nuclease HARBI1 [Temnothorax longispinosus]|uniref:Putative nuclease HARBI1 n=1 Tax=Temnothorax longispinosus TaxID=300112 RepID=A0A4S2L3C5_9HYME|nr:putative nuclease HARBI1 [Temnothorax longispinosus]
MRKVIDEVFCENNDDDDESDDEVEIMLATVMHEEKEVGPNPARCQNFVELVVPRFTFKQFQENFRMSAPAFEILLAVIAPLLENRTGTGRPTTRIEKQLLAVVWLLATPDCFRSIGMKFDMSKSTLHSCFRRVIVALVCISHRLNYCLAYRQKVRKDCSEVQRYCWYDGSDWCNRRLLCSH